MSGGVDGKEEAEFECSGGVEENPLDPKWESISSRC